MVMIGYLLCFCCTAFADFFFQITSFFFQDILSAPDHVWPAREISLKLLLAGGCMVDPREYAYCNMGCIELAYESFIISDAMTMSCFVVNVSRMHHYVCP